MVSVIVGGGLGFKVGQKIAQWAAFKKTGSYITQGVSTVSGVILVAGGTWVLLNKFYKV